MSVWFPFNKEKKDCDICMFVFHHAGGSASVYLNWMPLSSEIEVLPVELPGNGCRIQETYIYDFDAIVQGAASEIAHYAKGKRIALYGHSMGAALAFCICEYLEQHLNNKVYALIVAGRHAPNYEYHNSYCSDMGLEKLAEELKKMGGTPDEVFENNDIRNYVLQRVWKDYRLNESFHYKNEIVQAPIWAHYGAADPDATKDMMMKWKDMTSRKCILKGFKGGHFFPLDLADEYFNEIERIIWSADS